MTTLPALLARGRRAEFGKLILNALAQAAMTIAGSLLVQQAFDVLILPATPPTPRLIALFGAGLAGVGGVAAWLRVGERMLGERLAQSYVRELRLRLFDHLAGTPVRNLQSRSRGALTLRLVGDLTALRQWISLGLSRLVVGLFVTIAAIGTLVWMNWPIALTVTLVLSLGFAASLPVGEALRITTRETRRQLGRLAANIAERVNAMAVVQVFGQTRRERARIGRFGDRLAAAMISKARETGRLRAVTDLTVASAHAAVILVGAWEISRRQTSAGAVVAAMSVVAVLLPQLRDLGRVHQYWHGAALSRRKIHDFLARPASWLTDPDDARELQGCAGRLELRNLSTGDGLAGIDAVVEAGQTVAIVGPNGAGKSTLLAAIARLVEPVTGEVRLDGQSLQACRLLSVRRAIGFVGPELPLLRGTLERNLRYRAPHASAEEYERALRVCGVDELLAELPEGVATRVAEGGIGLSIGQRQRIALARALLGSPRVLLLDEADANLDARASQVIDRVIDTFDGTVLVVTHRRERLQRADMIWYLDKGQLVERGTPAQLLDGDTRTARLFGRARIVAA